VLQQFLCGKLNDMVTGFLIWAGDLERSRRSSYALAGSMLNLTNQSDNHTRLLASRSLPPTGASWELLTFESAAHCTLIRFLNCIAILHKESVRFQNKCLKCSVGPKQNKAVFFSTFPMICVFFANPFFP
jgi:hypothetical protein